ncbi:MAG: phenylalanine--tRNA ligase subunit beta [Candidatus Ranarchaeia archaeon]
MPTITLALNDVRQRLRRQIALDELEAELPWIGLDIEDKGEDWIKVEYNPNRPDFSSPIGIIRALKGRMGIEVGRPRYETKPSKAFVEVDASVADVRPYIVMAIIRDVKVTEENVSYIMNMQEDLHWAVGRDRRKAAIGLHDLDKTKAPYRYFGALPDEYRFEPLQEKQEMTLKEILLHHPKGQKYSHLVKGKTRYPLITDAKDGVLSFPPIINGTMTQITETTKNFLVDITGPSKTAIYNALNIVTTAFADEGCPIETLEIRYPDYTEVTPEFTPKSMSLDIQYANRLLGLSLSGNDVVRYLRKCRLDASLQSGNKVQVTLPPYRVDLLHQVGLVEEVAIGYGLDRLTPTMPKTASIGQPHPAIELAYLVREIMIGYGYQDLITFNIANRDDQLHKAHVVEEPVLLSSPVSLEYNIVRSSMLPSLLNVLSANKHNDIPQKIFEVGDTVHLDSGRYTMTRRQMTLGAASLHHNASFTEIKSILAGLLHELRVPAKNIQYKPFKDKRYLNGRAAQVMYNKKVLGCLGEIHPQVLTASILEYPCVYFEINLELFTPKTKATIS